MEIPRFSRENLNARLVHEDLGEAFQDIVHELLLPDYPELHRFPSRGKDGAIELSETKAASRSIVECKQITKDGLPEAQKRWRDVAHKLRTHLADPSGPRRGQGQYRPWYRKDPTIREYLFCISSQLVNQDQKDQLKQEIVEFFTELVKEYAHLLHLTDLSVTVFDWNDLCTRLQQRPHLPFRWFPRIRPHGLVPLHDVPDVGTFRSYLASGKLPFYSRAQHLKDIPAPEGVDIPDEEGLLSQLGTNYTSGLVVTGRGGLGKTRLTLEIARRADSKGWLVLRVQGRLREDALEHLAERITPDTPVLLLLDYIEAQRNFTDFAETLNDLNDAYSLRLYYVASCRPSYYKTIAAVPRLRQVDLSPVVQGSGQSWEENYRRQAVRHILEHSGVEVTGQHLAICRDIPILAVFVSYLSSQGRQAELAELLNEADFGTWVAKRLQLSFSQTIIDRDLALLIALFPMPAQDFNRVGQRKGTSLLDILAADGWIEELPADELRAFGMWVTAHDVLADQILLSYLKGIPHTAELFVNELLSLACKVDCLHSALLTLQRLSDQPQLNSLDWPKILGEQMRDDPDAWREARDIVIRTSLLTAPQTIVLLDEHEKVWNGAEEETGFQNALGWLARAAVKEEVPGLEARHRAILESWVQKAAKCVSHNNFILTWGIQLCPESIREPALKWILARPLAFQTHYLLVAWLGCGLPPDDIASSVRQWAAGFQRKPHLSFVARAWLDAGGDKERVRAPIEAWLEEHKTKPEAGFVYKAWLETGGDKEWVRAPIEAWLKEHKTKPEAGFVYKAWLDAGGDKEWVRAPIEAWLKEHKTKPEAEFVYKAWLDAGGDKERVRAPIEAWLKEHKTK